MEKQYRVFVASTYLDNRERRKLVEDAIQRARMIPVGMEWFAANERPTVDVCRQIAGECDVFVVIIAHRYGWIPEGQARSITELEYEAAAGLPRLAFVIDPEVPAAPDDLDPEPDRAVMQAKLRAFRERCARDQMPVCFRDTTLGTNVIHALVDWRDRQERGLASGADLVLSSLRGESRVLPLDGHPLLQTADGEPVLGGGCRVSFTISHNNRQPSAIAITALKLNLLSYEPGRDAALDYQVDGDRLFAAGSARLNRFAIELDGPKQSRARWVVSQRPRRTALARSDNLLDIESDERMVLRGAVSDLEEFAGTVICRAAGRYRFEFAVHYSVDGVDQVKRTEAMRIYSMG